jgi:ATP-dependent helicase Lhr and Lhr-like helicase
MSPKSSQNILTQFHPIIENWFNSTFQTPTPSQVKGWPAIFKKQNTLILAPTGSGKTLAAFLVCINEIMEELLEKKQVEGVHTLYISPLKALNYDIERNLEAPLKGIQQIANEQKIIMPEINVAVRTGDTPQKERQRMIKRPPHILITTPESLHLLLTSKKSSQFLKPVKYVIVDEIHALSENKRGTFLTVLLERLQMISTTNFTRIGLSATQKPLTEIAKFLGGYSFKNNSETNYVPRPVTIVDAGMRKKLDLKILNPVADFKSLPENTIWPDIYQKLVDLIHEHKTTLIFANNRAAVERITSELNDRAGFELAKAHHGSVSKDIRKQIEQELKRGDLTAMVATATLELGIDMGAIDLVCQVESPKSIARGLQRVGRAGHLYKAASKGRFIPKMRSDLLEIAVITRAMYEADVAPIRIPTNCLDILAQQIVAMVALKQWEVDDLFQFIKRAYPYANLPRAHFLNVVEMISGRYPAETFRDLKPRVSWDKINNVLHPLPGTQRAAILGGGAIPDTGQYGCYLEDGATKIGELEEEFIYERRVGEVFVLGTNTWRIQDITLDKVLVSPAPGEPATMPFWKGEYFHRSAHLGKKIGEFCRQLSNKLNDPDCLTWLQSNYFLNNNAAENLYEFFVDQKQKAGCIPNDQTILIETFPDETGDLRFVLLSPFGGFVHLPWKLAILAQFRKLLNIEPESYHADTGLTFRYPIENPDSFYNVFKSVTAENVEDLIIEELAKSFFFGLRFRQNAGRALLMPLFFPGKRTPLWLQRMRARDLLEVARSFPSFPIVFETYRESMQDFLAINELKQLLNKIETGEVKIIFRRASSPSPFVSSLLFDFQHGYMYEYEEPKAGSFPAEIIDKTSLKELLGSDNISKLLDESAALELEERLQAQKQNFQSRTPVELIELLRRIGDLTEEELSRRITGDLDSFLKPLVQDKRIAKIHLPKIKDGERWIATEDFPLFRDAFSLNITDRVREQELLSEKFETQDAQEKILQRYIRNHSLVTEQQICSRYPFEKSFIRQYLEQKQKTDGLVKIPAKKQTEETRWAYRETVERIRRISLKQQRQQIQACDTGQFANFLLNWQHRTEESRLFGVDGLLNILEQFQGLALPAKIWENEIFAHRLKDYSPAWLDELCQSGEIIWNGSAPASKSGLHISFLFRENFVILQYSRTSKSESKSENDHVSIIRNTLQQKGACFVTELAIESGLSPSICANVLWKLIELGEVSNDKFSVIRTGKKNIASQKVPLQAEKFRGRSKIERYRQHKHLRPGTGLGRWFLIPTNNSSDGYNSKNLEFVTRILLRRYGLVCRELYEMENLNIPWRLIYETLIRLEWRGEIRRGYFVKGLSGVQFAQPAAAEELMSFQTKPEKINPVENMILINSCDPANLYGAASPLPLLHSVHHDWRFYRHPNNYLILKSGMPVLAIEANGKRLIPMRDLNNEEKKTAMRLLPQLFESQGGWRNIRSIKVELWNNEPVRNSEIADYLKEIGFRDEFKMMILERKFR